MGVWRNALYSDALHSRGILTFLFLWQGFLWATTYAFFIIAGFDSDQAATGLSTLFSMMGFIFCGVLAGPEALPRFWIFMYYASPFTYLVGGFLSSALANAPMHCSDTELVSFEAPQNQTCAQYMEPYMQANAGGYLTNPDTMGGGSDLCQFCSMDSTNQFLSNVNINWDDHWRNFGILWAYIAFNTAAAILIYWLVRVPKGKKKL